VALRLRPRRYAVNTLEYKGYTGTMEVDIEAKVIFGRVTNIRTVITFESETIPEAEQAFRDSIDDYLAWCAEDGMEPEKPDSGQFRFRTTPEHQRLIALAAAREGKSINTWLDEIATRAAQQELAEIR
jgi:predicted HicB family RNase H-like nuclease